MSGILDLAQSDQGVAMGPQPGEQARLPATFGEGFEAAWHENQLFGQSVARTNARVQALDDYMNEVSQKTGKDIRGPVAAAAEAGEPMMWMAAQQEAKKLGLTPPTDDEITERAALLSRQARQDYADVAAREKAGGGAGIFFGGLAGATTDPINLLAAPVGGGEGGVLLTALKFGAAAAATQGGNEALQAGYREQVQPGYAASGEPLSNVLMAGAQGAVLGGGTKALGNLWTRVKTGTWPTSVRDAGNLLESEANVQHTNVYQGVAGEAAHRDALGTAIDQVAKGEPVDVAAHITPEVEASARGIMTRLEGEQGASLPIFDERAIRLTSEEAGLRSRVAEINQHVAGLPEGDVSAADRLNRLEAVDRQLEAATGAARKALQDRRDQILVDTSPEALRKAAAPIAARQAAETERANIAARLNEIAAERAKFEAEPAPPMIGQRQMVPFERVRAATQALTDAAAAERAGQAGAAAPELPFAATAREAQAAQAGEALKSGVAQIAERGGHVLAPDEIAAIASRLAKMTPEEAADAARDIQMRPHQMAAEPARVAREAALPEPARELAPDTVTKMLGSPDHEAAVRADIDRARMTGDVKIPAGVDEKGEPIFRSLDAAMDEVDGYKAAADEIKACANPAQEAAE